ELPYIQDFSGVEAGQIPAGWNQDDKSNFEWKVTDANDVHYLKFPVQVGSGYVYSGYSKLLMPVLSLDGVDRERLELIFSYSQKAYSSRLDVLLSTDGGENWTKLTGSGNPLGQLSYASSAASVVTDEKVLALKELVGDATSLMIRFDATYSSSSDEVKLYDVRVQEHPRCLPPADLHVVTETQTPTGVELAWTAPEEIAPTAYRLLYGEAEIDWEAEVDPEELGIDALTKKLENLKANHTLYYVSMRSVCGDEGESDPTGLTFHTLYTCPKITDLHLKKLTENSAEWAFSYALDATYEAMYKPVAAAEWIPLASVFNTTSFELAALQPDTRYMLRLRVICAEDDQSLWDTAGFRTPCALRALPLHEGFEETFTEWAPACWRYERIDGPASILQWERAVNIKQHGQASLRHPGNTGGTAVMISPYLDFAPNEYYRLSFYLRREGYESAKTDGLGLWFNTAPNLTGGREVAFLKNHEDDAAYPSEEAVGTIGEKWRLFTFDSLTGLEAGYLMLYAQGDASQDKPFYIDELSVTRIYATNLELRAVAPMPARANMGGETVAVVLNNTGEKDFTGEVTLSYQVNALPAVSETLTFTAERPLASQTPFTYTFAAKADLSAKGTYVVKAMLETAGDPLPDDNTAALTTESYEALALPFETDFSPASAGAAYIHTVNADQDDYEWILPPSQPQAMIYGRNSGHLDDYLYTPGLALPAGNYEVSITYAARQATYLERLSVGAYARFTAKETALSILTDTTAATARKTAEGLLEIAEDGIYMLGIHAESDSSRGINVYSLSIKALKEPENKPLVSAALRDTICEGETYRFGGRELTEAGRYVDTARGAEADTVRELTLTVLSKPEPPVVRREDEGTAVTLVAETPEASVQWYDADGMIFGAEEKRFTVTFNGVYHATAVGVCGESAPSNKVKIENLSVEDGLSADAPLLYPNPSADGRFMLAVSPAYEGATLYVYGMDGRLRQRQTLCAGEQEIRLKAVEPGVYMLRFVTADGRTRGLKVTVR
nr:T9SS type A sorting domain-containing protein [Bacteroidales bacterium]